MTYGCTLKAYRGGDLARASRSTARCIVSCRDRGRAGAHITELQVNFRPRRTGASKYGPGRIVRTFLDLMTVKFLSGYSTRPIQVFGAIGLLIGSIGAIWMAILVFEKVFLGSHLADRPALLLAVLLVVVGVQFVSLGLIGEMIARTYHESQHKPIYLIKEEF